jgi:hypothetical protein
MVIVRRLFTHRIVDANVTATLCSRHWELTVWFDRLDSDLKKRAIKEKQHFYSTKLDLFAREFDSEDKLRKVVADLLRKMGHKGVRITHSPAEKGKDIVFYAIGPLGEKRLFACVVKNKPINGQAEDYKNGAPTIVSQIQGVVNQVQASFSEPLPSGRGVDEWVDSVYIISPYECPIATIDSVKNVVARSGQIVFKCGQELLELFAEHWCEFLWFESTVLLSYLSALREGLEDDYALANLILRKAFLANSPGGLAELYVEPVFHRELDLRTRRALHSPNPTLLSKPCEYSEIRAELKIAKLVAKILETAPIWIGEPECTEPLVVAEDVIRVGAQIEELWENAYQQYVAKVMADARKGSLRNVGALWAPPKNEVSVSLGADSVFKEVVEATKKRADAILARLDEVTKTANDFARSEQVDSLGALRSPWYLLYSQITETASVVPFAFESSESCGVLRFGERLLDEFDRSLLITAAAGFGKTTFCRWHAIRDANRLVNKEATVLPVYVALHSLSSGRLDSFEETFFQSEELRKLLQLQLKGQSPFERVRLYLDGLDEVTSLSRQKEIIELAREAARQLPSLQVVVTGRDHVRGAWLNWLSRVRLSPLSDEKTRQLATRWLGEDRVDVFQKRLDEAESLAALMKIPLLATLILAVYRKTGTVPPNKTTLYSLFVELLCGGWDVYKNIQRRDNQFSIKDKTVVLTRLAGILQLQSKRDAGANDFRSAVKNTFPSFLPECEQLLNEIVEDGLLIRMGSALAYSHLSFQEYLAARDLHDPTGNRPKLAVSRYFKGEDWWREPLGFYVTMCERPAEMDEWVAKLAMTSTSKTVDLDERALFLHRSLLAAFPAYRESPTTKDLFQKVLEKARRLGSARE